MVKKSAKQRFDDFVERQDRREEALDIIAQIAALEKRGPGNKSVTEIEVESEESKNKKKKKKNKKKNNNKTELTNVSVEPESENKSSFIDNRGSIKGFANIPKVSKKKRKYNWKERIAEEERKRRKFQDDEFFDSTDDEEVDDKLSDEEEKSDDEEGNNEGEDGDDDNEDDSDEEVGDNEGDTDSEDEDIPERKKLSILNQKASSFKNWIEEQTEKPAPTPISNIDYKPIDRPEDREALSDEEEIKIYEDSINDEKPAFYINVIRDPEIQEIREELPVFKKEAEIMETIKHHEIVIICGETGSGKTTQLPQFLFEAGYGNEKSGNPGMIGVTQPRRVAAMSMAERVGKELGNHGEKVSYQVRFNTTVKGNTKIKFMTDGVLLREMMSDFLLNKYSVLVIDEAHERNINTDILIGMLSRVVKLRNKKHFEDPSKNSPLKLIIMSATLRVADFSMNKKLFSMPPPILKVEARMFPVSIHFNKRTPYNYVDEAFRKTCKIHQRLPRGGILIFLTSQQEIMDLVKKLRQRFPYIKKGEKIIIPESNVEMKVNSKEANVEDEEIEFNINDQNKDDFDEEGEDEENEEGFEEELEDGQTAEDPLYVLPLYSLLPTKEQMKVFQPPPGNARICVVATNIAETSITIPNIRYVVDAGRCKQKILNKNSVQSYEVTWVSQASAEQRSGRAGRTGPGHTYRLYSSAIFDEFEKFSIPEILRMPIESVVLQMKSIGIDNIENFPFPTKVESQALVKAEKLLQYLGALNNEKMITKLGKNMSLFPLSPRFAKMLLTGNQFECLPYIITIVCALSVGDPFLSDIDLGINRMILNEDIENEEDDKIFNEKKSQKETMSEILKNFTRSQIKFTGLSKTSDALKILSAISAVDYYKDFNKREKFIKDNFMRSKVVEEIGKLRKQLLYIVKVNTTKESIGVEISYEKELKLRPPNKNQIFAIKQIITTGFIDQVAIRGDLINADVKLTKRSSITTIPYSTIFPAVDNFNKEDEDIDPFVYIHPSSILCNLSSTPPDYLVYQQLDLNNLKTRIRVRPLTDIDGKALTNIAKKTSLLSYSKPLGPPYGPKMISANEQKAYVIPRFGGLVSWDLPPIEVIQHKVQGQWVTKG